MYVTIQHFNGCPNWLEAVENVEQAIERGGLESEVQLQLITSPEQAEALEFRGSPTILIDGRDPFADSNAPVGLSCRIYQTPQGPAGSPTVEQLTAVLSGS
ncbi:MAG: thioredoxin family protein [Acidimicrobiia bacterium]|nr:thioredoxin family protein [Acidimicrobiia bacterium]